MTFNHFDDSDMDLEEWSLGEYPYEEDVTDRDLAIQASDLWVDLEDDDEDEEDGEVASGSQSLVISPTRSNSSYTYYNARLRPQHPPPTRPRRGQRRRSPQYQAMGL